MKLILYVGVGEATGDLNTAAIAIVVTRMVVTENYQRVNAESEDAQGKVLSGVEADGQI